jgi:multisubunit Na+/H+ antiporter MnhG subunit
MQERRRSTLVPFGAVMLMLVGAFNVMDGFVAVVNPDYMRRDVLVSHLAVWGWAFIVFGVAQFGLGVAILRGSAIALWPAISVAGLNALAQLGNFRMQPVWSIAIVVADAVAIYAFMAEGMALGSEEVDVERGWGADGRDDAGAPEARVAPGAQAAARRT